MKVTATEIPEVLIIEPKLIGDSRGLFVETYQKSRYAANGVAGEFVQDNLSRSACGVLRGLHFQAPRVQGKLVSVVQGRILDVAVDVRLGGPTFAKHVKVMLDDQRRQQLWVPQGFAHGFLVLSSTADVYYKCTEFYSPKDEMVLRWNDPELRIEWGCENPILSERDSKGRTLSKLLDFLPSYDELTRCES
jgi:dTDP-4-dehydrorhamnose 3,5-epimerase